MPLFSVKGKKRVGSCPEVDVKTRPLLYAQSPSSLPSSVPDPTIVESERRPQIRPQTHKAITSDPSADITYYKEQQANRKADAASNANQDGNSEDTNTNTDAKLPGLLADTTTTETPSEPAAAFDRYLQPKNMKMIT